MSFWIETISDEDATGFLKEMYDLARTPHGTVDNVMVAQSLRPHTIAGHMALYKSVLHSGNNSLPLWFLEVVASYTSIKNSCAYSLQHHFRNARRLLGDDQKADRILESLKRNSPGEVFDGKFLALLKYADQLTTRVSNMTEQDIIAAREAGCDDGEIVEVNQVVAYFNYSNRLLNGLGVTTSGDTIGYYP